MRRDKQNGTNRNGDPRKGVRDHKPRQGYTYFARVSFRCRYANCWRDIDPNYTYHNTSPPHPALTVIVSRRGVLPGLISPPTPERSSTYRPPAVLPCTRAAPLPPRHSAPASGRPRGCRTPRQASCHVTGLPYSARLAARGVRPARAATHGVCSRHLVARGGEGRAAGR